MTYPISLLGVALAFVSAFLIGSLIYGPRTFFPLWQKLTDASDAHVKKNFGKSMIGQAVSALLTAYVLAHFTSYTMEVTGVAGVAGGLVTALWVWLGFAFTTTLSNEAFDPRDKKLLILHAVDRLITLVVMGAILGAFM